MNLNYTQDGLRNPLAYLKNNPNWIPCDSCGSKAGMPREWSPGRDLMDYLKAEGIIERLDFGDKREVGVNYLFIRENLMLVPKDAAEAIQMADVIESWKHNGTTSQYFTSVADRFLQNVKVSR